MYYPSLSVDETDCDRVRSLLLTLLVDAITVYVAGREWEGEEKKEEWSEASDWIFSDADDCAGFVTACLELELPPDLVRKRVKVMQPADLNDLRRMCEP